MLLWRLRGGCAGGAGMLKLAVKFIEDTMKNNLSLNVSNKVLKWMKHLKISGRDCPSPRVTLCHRDSSNRTNRSIFPVYFEMTHTAALGFRT
jgi:hypothetical protein